jgi:hypothetical protein
LPIQGGEFLKLVFRISLLTTRLKDKILDKIQGL